LTTAPIWAEDPPAAEVQRLRPVRNVDLIDDTQEEEVLEIRAEEKPRPDAAKWYYLGTSLSSVSKALDEQLQLDGAGALVVEVDNDSPADKAGLKLHDIVTAAGDTPIRQLSDVTAAVEKSKGRELSFKVLRAGKPITVTVTPVERYVEHNPVKPPQRSTIEEDEVDLDLGKLEARIREKLRDHGVDVRMQLIKPGHFVPRGLSWIVEQPEDFPQDLTVVVRKQGDKPAEIEATQGDKTWKVTENELDELPDDVRGHVAPYLGRVPSRFRVTLPGGKDFTVPVPPAVAAPLFDGSDAIIPRTDVQTRERLRGALERRVDELSRDMDRVRERMEGLRRSLRDELDSGKQDQTDQ
jgi:membrane-associated protease RseP (regulator of RpoE activity)